MAGDRGGSEARAGVSLWRVLVEWGRIGCIGFGGPPAHIALLRRLCVERNPWMTATDFEDAVADFGQACPKSATATSCSPL